MGNKRGSAQQGEQSEQRAPPFPGRVTRWQERKQTSSSALSLLRFFSDAKLDSSSLASLADRIAARAIRLTASPYCARTSSSVPR